MAPRNPAKLAHGVLEEVTMRGRVRLFGLIAIALAVAVLPQAAFAFRMIQNTGVGTFSAGAAVPCNAAGGFTHWGGTTTTWYLNEARQGAGKAGAVQGALSAWTGAPASYVLNYGGTTTTGMSGSDGRNTLLWRKNGLCAGNCLAVTALTLASGQVITDVDIQFNDRVSWQTSGGNYDTQAVAAHEVGHGMGIHHTELSSTPRPTMYAYYFGTDGRTLESDDRAALDCADNRYFVPGGNDLRPAGETAPNGPAGGLALSARRRDGVNLLRFSLQKPEAVKLEIYTVSGRHLTTLIDGRRGAGDHEIAWDGTSDTGPVGSGVYFARLTTTAGEAKAKLFALR